jgi:hypothetical protein
MCHGHGAYLGCAVSLSTSVKNRPLLDPGQVTDLLFMKAERLATLLSWVLALFGPTD